MLSHRHPNLHGGNLDSLARSRTHGRRQEEEEDDEEEEETEEVEEEGENWGRSSPSSTHCCCVCLLYFSVQLLPGFHTSLLFVRSRYFIFSFSLNITGWRKSLSAPASAAVVESSSCLELGICLYVALSLTFCACRPFAEPPSQVYAESKKKKKKSLTGSAVDQRASPLCSWGADEKEPQRLAGSRSG